MLSAISDLGGCVRPRSNADHDGPVAPGTHAVPPQQLELDGHRLRMEDVVAVARGRGTDVRISAEAERRVTMSEQLKQRLVATGRPIYGVTTGFGDSADRQIAADKSVELQRVMVRNLHGTGPASPDEVVRATMLIRANCLARGNSGVSPAMLRRLLDLVRHDVLPQIPERGSVGASGDLMPLSYVVAGLTGRGKVSFQGATREAADVLADLGLEPVEPAAKDTLAMINGTSFSSAFAALAIHDALRLAPVADVCTALASEALLGYRGHFAAFVHEQKPHPGQLTSARLINRLLEGSRLTTEPEHTGDASTAPLGDGGVRRLARVVQDRYSIRCAPHVTGVLRDTLVWARQWLETEINASDDNPLFDLATGSVHSGGNFYAGHICQAMDSLKVAVANIADLLDRQLELLVDEKFNNGLTANLTAPAGDDDWAAGLQHGFKPMQIVASAITAEALKNTGPVSVFSRSTEAHNQDKVALAPISARDARVVIGLVEEVAAIHLLAACQALDLRGPERAGPRTGAIHALIRRSAPFVDRDRSMSDEIAAVVELIRSGAIGALAHDTGDGDGDGGIRDAAGAAGAAT
jgi:phenylalanine ammonia-lyase